MIETIMSTMIKKENHQQTSQNVIITIKNLGMQRTTNFSSFNITNDISNGRDIY